MQCKTQIIIGQPINHYFQYFLNWQVCLWNPSLITTNKQMCGRLLSLRFSSSVELCRSEEPSEFKRERAF